MRRVHCSYFCPELGLQIYERVLTVDVSPASDVTSEVMGQCLICARKVCDGYVAIVIDRLTQFHDCNVVSGTEDMLGGVNDGYKRKGSTVCGHYTRFQGRGSTRGGQ